MGVMLRRLLPLGILCIFGGLSVVVFLNKPQPQRKTVEKIVPVLEVAQVKKQDLQLTVNSYGVVKPKHQAELVSQVSGVIYRLANDFSVGKFVRKDDVLAYLYDDDYRADVAQATAALAQAQALLEEEIARGIVAKKTLRNIPSNKQSALGLRLPQRQHQEANVKFAQAALARAQRNLDRTVIKAPFDGLIVAKNIHIGSHVAIGEHLGLIYSTDSAEVRLPVTPKALTLLDFDNSNNRQLLLTSEHSPQPWLATFIRSEGQVDQQSRMIYLIAEISDPYQLASSKANINTPILKFGTFVTTVISGRKVTNVVKLPRHVVRNSAVVLIDGTGKTQTRKINVIHADLEHVYIASGIDNEELISLIWPDDLVDGTSVNVVIRADHAPELPPLMVVNPKPVHSGG